MLSLLVLAGCTGLAPIDVRRGLPNDPTSDPRVPTANLLPWPSSYFLVEDASTATGYRVALPEGALPGGDTPTDPAPYNLRDGFSTLGPILALFPEGVDPASLPAPATTASLDSPVLLVDLATGVPEPLLVELDAGAPSPDRRALILRPLRSLQPGTRYAVAIRGLWGPHGQPITPSDAFLALRDDIISDSEAVERLRPGAEDTFAALDALGIPRGDLLLAWDFVTASAASRDADLLQLAEEVRAWSEPWSPAFTLDEAVVGEAGTWRRVEGAFTVPWYLTEEGRLERDADGRIVRQGVRTQPFVVGVPASVTGASKAVLYGPGVPEDHTALDNPDVQALLHGWALPFVVTDLVPADEDDDGTELGGALHSLDDLPRVTDRAYQGLVGQLALARVLREALPSHLVHDDTSATPGAPLLDGTYVFAGYSLGATFGPAFLALDPHVERGLLVGGGGSWANTLERSSLWDDGAACVACSLVAGVPDPLDRQALLASFALLSDPLDAATFLPRVVDDPFAFNQAKPVALHVGLHDSVVPTLGVEIAARGAGLPLVTPAPVDLYGIDTVSARVSLADASALVVYDLGAEPLPAGNIPPEANHVHADLRRQPAFLEQGGHFLHTGEIAHLCDGPCDPD